MPAQKKPSHRGFRIADQIQKDLSELIARELKDPRVGLVTVQAVDVTPDYAHAKVYVSVLQGDEKKSLEGLRQAAGFLRTHLFKRLHIHTVPTLHFELDQTIERAIDMDTLIQKALRKQALD